MSIVNVAILRHNEAYEMSGLGRDRAFKQFIRPNVYGDDVLIAMLSPRGLKQCVVTVLAHVATSAMKDTNSIIVCLYETLDVILSSFGNGVNDHAFTLVEVSFPL